MATFPDPEQVTAAGRSLALAITDMLDTKRIDPDTAIMAMTCVIASMLAEIDDDEDEKINWFVGNLRMLMRSYRSFVDRVIMQ